MNKIDQLKALKELLDNETINTEEFKKLKEEIINLDDSQIQVVLGSDEISVKSEVSFVKSDIADYFIVEPSKDKFSQTEFYWFKEPIFLENSCPDMLSVVKFGNQFTSTFELLLGFEINNFGFQVIYNLSINLKELDAKVEQYVNFGSMLSSPEMKFIVDGKAEVLVISNCLKHKISPYFGCAEQAQLVSDSRAIIEKLATSNTVEYEVSYNTPEYKNQRASHGFLNDNDRLKFKVLYNCFFDNKFQSIEIQSKMDFNKTENTMKVDCYHDQNAYRFGREMALMAKWSACALTLSEAIEISANETFTANNSCVKRGFEDELAGIEGPF